MFGTSIASASMEKSLSALWQRNETVLHNIVNEETPGYKAKRVEFEGLLRKEMRARTRVSAVGEDDTIARIQNIQPKVYQDKATSMRADGNNVDIDSEQMELARIQIQYNALQQKISSHYSNMRYAITGGR